MIPQNYENYGKVATPLFNYHSLLHDLCRESKASKEEVKRK